MSTADSCGCDHVEFLNIIANRFQQELITENGVCWLMVAKANATKN